MKSIVPILLPAILLVGCAQLPPTPQPYTEPAREASPTRQSAVDLLQQEADEALKTANYPLAIETLQRALRIEPRNPYSWHYLGLTYLAMGDFTRCRAMADRSDGFAAADDQLTDLNSRLRNRCAEN